MKRQVFLVLSYLIDTVQTDNYLRMQMNALRIFYQYCIEQKIKDIEMLELCQIQNSRCTWRERKSRSILNSGYSEKSAFWQAQEIHWEAHVWYFDRFCFQPERVDPSISVRSLSFLEVTNPRNRELLKQYMRYGLGITNLTIYNLRSEFLNIRNF